MKNTIRKKTKGVLFGIFYLIAFGAFLLLGCSKYKSVSYEADFDSAFGTQPLDPVRKTDAYCNYVVEGVIPVSVGSQIFEKVTCKNLPAGAIVQLIKSKDSGLQYRFVISVTNTSEYKLGLMNDGSSTIAGRYYRNVEVYSATNVLLFSSSRVSFDLLPSQSTTPNPTPRPMPTPLPVPEPVPLPLPTPNPIPNPVPTPMPNPTGIDCLYSFSGYRADNTVPFAPEYTPTYSERVLCKNLPASAEVRLVGTKNGKSDINEVLTLKSNGYHLFDIKSNGLLMNTGTYTRKAVVIDIATRAIIMSSPEVSYILLPPPSNGFCDLSVTPPEQSQNISFGAEIADVIACSGLPTGSEVRLIGTKNGIEDVNLVLNLTKSSIQDVSGLVIARKNDDIAKSGVYKRRIIVTDLGTGRTLISTNEITYTFMPDIGCDLKMSQPRAGYVHEEIDCKRLPNGAVVWLWYPDEKGIYTYMPITLPFSRDYAHHEYEVVNGSRYLYRRKLEVMNLGRTIYYDRNDWQYNFWKDKTSGARDWVQLRDGTIVYLD